MKTLVVVEPGFRDYKEHILKSLAEVEGIRIILVTGLTDIIDPSWCKDYVTEILEFSYPADTIIEVLESYTKKSNQRIDGVLTYVEPSVHYANQIAHHFGVPVIATHLDKSIRSKRRVRTLLAAAGVPQVWFRGLSNEHDLEKLIQSKPVFPMIVKPSEMMSSLGVKLVHNSDELKKAVLRAKMADFSGENLRTIYGDISSDVICEEYIDGPEYSVESIVQNGHTRVVGITKKWTGDTGFFDEVGHCFPALDIDSKTRLAVKDLVCNVHRVLNISNSMTHLEFRLRDGMPHLIEINCRLGGDLISEIVQRSTKTSIGRLLAQIATGEYIDEIPIAKETHSVTFVTTNKAGRVIGINRDNQITPAAEIHFFVSEGDFITTDDLSGPPRLAAAYAVGLPASGDDIESRFTIQTPFYTEHNAMTADTLHVFHAVESDVIRLNNIEVESWSPAQRASKENISARLKYHAKHHLLAYSMQSRKPVGFIAGVPLEQKSRSVEISWKHYASLAELPFPSDSHAQSLYIISISVLPDAPRGTETSLVRSAVKHCKMNRLSFLRYGIRTPKFAEAEATGITFMQYYAGLINGNFHEDLYRLAVNAGGTAIAPLNSYFDDPLSRDHAILIEHQTEDYPAIEVSK